MKTLRLILGDQLNRKISCLNDASKDDLILMCELNDEATYAKHHKKKIAFLFAAMRHFADELRGDGYNVIYTKIDDNANSHNFTDEVKKAVKEHNIQKLISTEGSEYRVLQMQKSWSDELKIEVEIRNDDRFLCEKREFANWAEGRRQLRMEFFYREMRKKYGILMEGDMPEGGKWNYDIQNRKPPKTGLDVPKKYSCQPDSITNDVIKIVEERYADHFGSLDDFHFAVTREDALKVLEQFIEKRIANFGDYQDAMLEDEPWMYHSHLSFYINCGLLLPMECVQAAVQAYYDKKASLNSVEGFVRQVIGWREFIRGIYWLKMPEYRDENFLDAKRKLPDFFWDYNKTKMNCLKQCIKNTYDNAYAHHIQRLMVLGNFLLLVGVDPDEVNEWYLIVYADAYEWVEMPNVSGMILFADAGVVASKPYVASGSYINKMSDYCKSCYYKPTLKNGEKACPFNYLYWNFLIEHKDKFKINQRMSMMYKTIEKMDMEKLQSIKEDSNKFLSSL